MGKKKKGIVEIHHSLKVKAQRFFKDVDHLKRIKDDLVPYLSKLVHESCHFMNAYILMRVDQINSSGDTCIDKTIIGHKVKTQSQVQTFVKNAMRILTHQLQKNSNSEECLRMKEFYDNIYSKLEGRPTFDKLDNGAHLLCSIAKEVQTNWINHYWVPFMRRQKQHIRLNGFNKDKRHAYDIQMIIWKGLDGHKPLYPFKRGEEQKVRQLSDEEKIFVLDQRQKMGLEDGESYTDSHWEKHFTHAILYHVEMIQKIESLTKEEIEDMKVRSFTISPLRDIRLAHIPIDSTILNHLFPKWIKTKKDIMDCMDTKEEKDDYLWGEFLNMNLFKKKVSPKWKFGNHIMTDGICISATFVEERSAPPTTPKSQDGNKKRKMSEVENEKINLMERDRGCFIDDQYVVECKEDDVEIIGIDPGRNVLMMANNLTTNEIHSLSKKRYYEESKMTKNNTWWKRYRKRHDLEEKLTTLPSFKITDHLKYMEGLKSKWKHNAVLWSRLAIKKRSENKFLTHRRRYKCLDTFFQTIIRGVKERGKKPIISFGAAKFGTSSKGEISGPLASLTRRCQQHAVTVMTNEYKTSQLCCECSSQLEHPKRKKYVKEKGETHHRSVEIWDLVWCKNTSHNHKFSNRDANASRNIAQILHSVLFHGHRPAHFSPPQKEATVEVKEPPAKRKRVENIEHADVNPSDALLKRKSVLDASRQ